MPKVSVIIPVYNVEQYLEKCLNSVCGQTLEDIEIICINDCSPDNSLEILKKYAAQDNRIKIIDFKENQGVSIARNAGIEAAKGEYIGFVDPDDYIDLDFYERLYECAAKSQALIVKGNLKGYDKKSGTVKIWQGLFDAIAENKIRFSTTFYTAVYKSDFIRKHTITFPEHCVFGQDVLFPLEAAYYADRVISISDVFYHYCPVDNSITKKPLTEKKILSYIAVHKLVFDFINTHPISAEDYFMAIEDIFMHIVGQFNEIESEHNKMMLREFLKFVLFNLKYENLNVKTDSINELKIEDDINRIISAWQKKRVFGKLRNLRKSDS